jgi:hypothetical protein
LSAHYANFDFAVKDRRMNLADLKDRVEARLRAAKSDDDAKRTFRLFLNAFGDAHLDIEWKSKSTDPAKDKAGGPLCMRLGFATQGNKGIDFTQVVGFTPVHDGDSEDFPGGVLKLAGGQTLGILRISLFMEAAHPALCEAARTSLGFQNDAACDDNCQERLNLEVANLLTAALERRIASLAQAGVAAIAVDITGNGGGTDWVGPAVRVLTPMPLPVSAIGVVRHQHWVKQLHSRLNTLEADLAAHGELDHGVLASAISTLRTEITEVSMPCGTSAYWEHASPKPSCTQLVRVAPVLAYVKPGALAGRASPEALFGPSRYQYHEGRNVLPLVVLVDEGTASAAEDFAEILQDHHAALIMGSSTVGAGCGFTNGGIPTVLPRSGGHVRIPDCARLRADGLNAVAGVTPDILLPLLERDSSYQRAKKIVAGLQSAWPAIIARKAAASKGVADGP